MPEPKNRLPWTSLCFPVSLAVLWQCCVLFCHAGPDVDANPAGLGATGEATSLAYINLVVAVPLIFMSVLGGAITDRVERRQLVIVGQTLITATKFLS